MTDIVAILTGKGGSKLKDKNIIKIKGKPCMYYPCKEAKKVKKIKYFFASSEDKKILNFSKKYGYETIKRPKSLSKKNTLHIDVIKHSLKYIQKKKIEPDILLILLANAPVVYAKWINDCLKIILKNKKITSVVPVVKNNDHHPMRAKRIKNRFIRSYFKNNLKISTNRQDLEDNYFICHNFWIIRTKNIFTNDGEPPWRFLGKKVMPYEVPNSIDIHEKEDLLLAENILTKND